MRERHEREENLNLKIQFLTVITYDNICPASLLPEKSQLFNGFDFDPFSYFPLTLQRVS